MLVVICVWPEQFEFSNVEKEAINQFLYWNDPEKNKFVYEMVSCCFDYCMMTIKQNNSAYKSIFNKKEFYLDANIIFRLMGLNHESRKKVIAAFINKCTEQKITVQITNHTRQEISDTIAHHIRLISNLLGNKMPIEPKAVWSMSTIVVNQSFYIAYYNWCKDETNPKGNYQAFERDLNKQAMDIINQFKQVDFDSFSETERELFDTYVHSLTAYKTARHKGTYEGNIRTDVNNYMFVAKKNEQIEGADFLSIHNYLISADHTFGEWAKEIRPGTIPIVVLPSVWYSILLQYSGRSDDDYASFSSFLNYSLSNADSGGHSEWKLNILKKVIEINESADIQSEILFGIEEKLRMNNIRDLEASGIEELIDETYKSVVEKEVAAAREEEQRKASAKLEEYKTEVQHQIARMANSSESEINLVKAENERLKSEAAEERVRNEAAIADGLEAGKKKELERIVLHEAEKRTKRTLRKYWIITAFMVFLSLVVVAGVFIWISRQPELSDVQKASLEWLRTLLAIIAFAGNSLVIGVKFKGLNRDKIYKQQFDKVLKEYTKE